MEDVSHHGRTVLFVSHNMPAVTRICPRTVLLDAGKVLADGPSQEVVPAYLRGGFGTSAERVWTDKMPGNGIAKLRAVRVLDGSSVPREAVDIRTPVGIEIEYEVLAPGHVLVPNFHCYTEEGVCAFVSSDTSREAQYEPKAVGTHRSVGWAPGNFFAEGAYIVHVAVSTVDPVDVHFYERDAVAFQVVDSMDGDSSRGRYAGPMPGVVRPMLRWTNAVTPRTTAESPSRPPREVRSSRV